MTQRASELFNEMRNNVEPLSNPLYESLRAVAAVLAPMFDRVERLEAERKASPPDNPVCCVCGKPITRGGLIGRDGLLHPNCSADKSLHTTKEPMAERPGATRGAEVAAKHVGTGDGTIELLGDGFGPRRDIRYEDGVAKRWGANALRLWAAALIDAERAAARRAAIDEAEGAVLELRATYPTEGVSWFAAQAAAAAVAKLKP